MSRIILIGMLTGAVSAVVVVVIMRLIGVESDPAVSAGVAGGVTGAVVTSVASSRKKDA